MNYFAENVFGRNDNAPLKHYQNDPGSLPPCNILINYMHEEMRQCFLNNLNHAATLMANALLEALLREVVYCKKKAGAKQVDVELWMKLQKLTLGPLIDQAIKVSAIDKVKGERLHIVKKEIRNAYQHGRFPDRVKKSAKIPTKRVNMKTGVVDDIETDPSEDKFITPLILMDYDRNQMPGLVLELDKLVRELMSGSIRNVAEGKCGFVGIGNPPNLDQISPAK